MSVGDKLYLNKVKKFLISSNKCDDVLIDIFQNSDYESFDLYMFKLFSKGYNLNIYCDLVRRILLYYPFETVSEANYIQNINILTYVLLEQRMN
jgi:hypothetical protein